MHCCPPAFGEDVTAQGGFQFKVTFIYCADLWRSVYAPIIGGIFIFDFKIAQNPLTINIFLDK